MWQEPRILGHSFRPPEGRTHRDPLVIHREMHHAAPELEERLAGIAVALVLRDGVLHRLFGQAVLQLEGRHRETVDEGAQVKRPLGLLAAVAELPGDAETVRRVTGDRFRALGRGGAAEAVEVKRPMLEALPQHVDDAAPGDLADQRGQAGLDVLHAALAPPVALGREVDAWVYSIMRVPGLESTMPFEN